MLLLTFSNIHRTEYYVHARAKYERTRLMLTFKYVQEVYLNDECKHSHVYVQTLTVTSIFCRPNANIQLLDVR